MILRKYLISGLVILLSAGSFFLYKNLYKKDAKEENSLALLEGTKLENPSSKKESYRYIVETYKTTDCPCCEVWIKYLEKNSIKVEVNILEYEEINKKRKEVGISQELESCHLSKVGDYFVEGHMPISGIDYLMNKKPDWIGIAVPGMPAGSPGMPGVSEYDVYAVFKDKTYKKILRYKNDELIKELE